MRTRYFALVLIVLGLVGTCTRAAVDAPGATPEPEGVVAPTLNAAPGDDPIAVAVREALAPR